MIQVYLLDDHEVVRQGLRTLVEGAGAIEVCRDVRSQDPTFRALVLTSYDDDEALFAAVMASTLIDHHPSTQVA